MEYKDITNPIELYNYMKENIKYGFVSKLDKKIYVRKIINNDELYDEMIYNHYYLQTPSELLESKHGICYDQVELIRCWFKEHNYEVITYFSSFHNHSIIIYKDENTYNLFERTLPGFNGIYSASSLEECLLIYKQIQEEKSNQKIPEIKLYKYDNVNFGDNFFRYVIANKKILKEDAKV